MNKYEKYKDSGIEWLGVIPEHWKTAKLKYCDTVIMGQSPSSDDYLLEPIGMPFLQGNAEFGKSYPTPKLWCNTANKIAIKGDILISVRAPIGAINIANCDYGIGRGLAAIRANRNIANYLFYLLHNLNEHLNSLGTGSTFTAISTDVLRDLEIPIPQIKEQTKIASYLDHKTTQIDSLIEKKEQLIEKLKLQRQAIINEAVTKGLNPDAPMKDSGIEWLGEVPEQWKVIQMRYCFSFTKGLSITKENLSDSGIPCVNYGEIHSKCGFEVNPEENELGCVSEDFLHTNENALLSKGDFVFADTSEDIEGSGNFTHLNSETPTFAGYHTIIARLKTSKEYRFFAYLFDSLAFRTQIREQVKGVKVFSITNKILRGALLFSPPEKEKAEIAKHIDNKTKSLFEAIQKLAESIEKLKLYRQSIISEAVTGKIDVRGWEMSEL